MGLFDADVAEPNSPQVRTGPARPRRRSLDSVACRHPLITADEPLARLAGRVQGLDVIYVG